MAVERLLQCLRLHDPGIGRRIGADRSDTLLEAFLVHVHD